MPRHNWCSTWSFLAAITVWPLACLARGRGLSLVALLVGLTLHHIGGADTLARQDHASGPLPLTAPPPVAAQTSAPLHMAQHTAEPPTRFSVTQQPGRSGGTEQAGRLGVTESPSL